MIRLKFYFFMKKLSLALLLVAGLAGSASAQYCTPSITISQCDVYAMYIDNFSTTGGITNITNNGTACGNTSTSYIYYSSHKHEGIQNTKVNFSYKIGPTYALGVKIWVDYNIDGDFTDAGEEVYASTSTITAGSTVSGNFTIPADAKPGNSRLRIRCIYASTAFTPCDAQNYGECEDYTFVIVPSCPAKFTQMPVDAAECSATKAIFATTAQSTDSFRWQVHTGSGGFADLYDGGPYSGTSSNTLTVNGLTNTMNGYRFRAIAYKKTEACTVQSNEAKLTVIPSGYPSITITANDNEICQGEEITIYSVYTKGGNSPRYQWKINGVDTPGMTAASFKASDLKDGDTVSCFFTSTEVCIFPKESNKITFKVHKLLDPYVSIGIKHNGGKSYTFTAKPENGGSNPHYQWFRNGNKLVGETNESYTADMPLHDRVHVEMVTSEECVTKKVVTSPVATAAQTSVDDMEQGGSLAVYPNPNNGKFAVKANIPAGVQQVNIIIVNALGQVVYNSPAAVQGGKLLQDIEVANTGVFFVQIVADGYRESARFTITE